MSIAVGDLRCEYKVNPIGMNVLSPRISWKLYSDNRNVMQVAYQLQVSKCKDIAKYLFWDTGKVDSDQSIHVEYMGNELESKVRYYYRVRVWDNNGNSSDWSETAFWEMGLLSSKEWIAEWITFDCGKVTPESNPCTMMRKDFEVKGIIKNARVYATSLGLYELQINGSRVSDNLFTPGWTSYNKRLQYQTYDVTEMLTQGKNAIGITLADGWYKGNLVWKGSRNLYGDKKAALLQLHITYENGSEEVILTDNGWKAATGPILMSEIYHGETYDARLEKDGWSTSIYNDSNWNIALTMEHTKDILVAQENVPVKAIEEIKPVSIITTPAGETVLDFGQNMVGWVRFNVSGRSGSKVVLKHAEVLDKDGNFYIDNLRAAKQTIDYTLKGVGTECYEPHFTFQGFRYVKLESYPGTPSLNDFTGIVIHSDMDKTGDFVCSDELINQLQHNILWGQKGNFLDVPTDCPQRDERLGWTGDAQVFIRTACFNMNVAPFFTKWLRDLKADQLETGGVPFVIPQVLDKSSNSSSAWGDAAVICPWTIYLCYADKRILEEQYVSMKSWVEYIRSQGSNEYLWNTGFQYGDWLGLDAKENSYTGATDKDFIATAFYAYCTQLLIKTARILYKEDDITVYEALYSKILENFKNEFITANGRLVSPTQTAHVLALMFNLVEGTDKERVIKTLHKYLEESKYHLTTGFVGTPYLCHVLSENGCHEESFKLAMQKDYPSWLYQVAKGATTIWEHWDGIKEDGSFWSKDMNSFNHYAYGSIGDWFYRKVCGINIDELNPGYKHIFIKPSPGQELSYAKAELETMYGTIISSWEENEKSMLIKIKIPHNTSATVMLPLAKLKDVYESGRRIDEAVGILLYEQMSEGVNLKVGSGSYMFEYVK